MGDHDHCYKLLFAHPRMVRDLLEAFVGGDWLSQIDFRTLERVSDSYVSEDLRSRADDIVWRVRCGNRYVYLLIEFQSSIEPFMAVRVHTYVGLLYQDLLRAGRFATDDLLPAILPIVLYNGMRRWRAAENIASLIEGAPIGLESYRAQGRYLLIDEGRYADNELAQMRNFAAVLFRLENCRQADKIPQIVATLVEWLASSAQDGLSRAFSIWLNRVVLARLSGGRVMGIDKLWERQSMLSERFDEWEAEFLRRGRQEGRAEGRKEGEAALLLRQLKKRFGELPAAVDTRLRSAQPEQLEEWGERLLNVASLNELFDGGSVAASEHVVR